ncbi:protein lethal(2)essential for life-like [Topomyia yanbarensis]|uniref:protein lethal(2)essential for life-like n=1 Tax=Topomyia yanbarensis TaxID=2498891 RepID=UPI00273AB1A3|nr:protein lethal(2)essential for life-like [Topomyia yanbarensis]
MSLVPMSFRDWWDDGWWTGPHRTAQLFDHQHFGSGIFNGTMGTFPPMVPLLPLRPLVFPRPWTNFSQPPFRNGISSLADKDNLQISLDVQLFSPSEITVKTVDNTVIVEGKHEEKPDEHGFVSRHFMRRYVLPSDHDPKDVISSLSSDGVLTIIARKKALPPPDPASVRTIPITQTGENSK